MKLQAENLPIILKACGREIRIIRDPQVHHGPSCANREGCGCRRYDSFLVIYHVGLARKRIRCATVRKAKDFADEIKLRFLAEDAESLLLTGVQRNEYLAAKNLLPDTSLEATVREFNQLRLEAEDLGMNPARAMALLADLVKRANGADLATAVDYFKQHGCPQVQPKKIPEIVQELIAALEADGRGRYHIRDLRLRLGRFSLAHPGFISDITTRMIEEWVRNLRTKDKKSLSPKSRNHHRDAVAQLFAYAKEHGYLPKTLPAATDSVKRLATISGENLTLTADDLRKVLAVATPAVIPGILIKAFAGLRTEEAAKLKWEHVHFDKHSIILSGSLTKLKQRRVVQMKPNLQAWLKPYQGLQGPVCGSYSSAQSAFKKWENYANKAGVKLGANRLRNSFISYHLGLSNDAAGTAIQAGNSPSIIRKDYLDLVTKMDAEEWFGIYPSKADLERITHWCLAQKELQQERVELGMPPIVG